MTTAHPGLAGHPIYLDYNSTTPVDPRVSDAALPYLAEHFGNPSSSHHYAEAPRHALSQARSQVAGLLGASPNEIVFTSGGSESDTLAVRGAALAQRDRGHHIITQQTEHPALLAVCDSLERLHGFRVTYLPVDRHGLVDPDAFEAAITPTTVLASIMHANNETGTIQPLSQLARIAHRHGVLLHTDAAQSVGKTPVHVDDLGVDLLTVAGHKMYAPKGVGALYVRAGTPLEPLNPGGGQEAGRRAGTENVALIAALGQAAALCQDELPDAPARLRELRDLLQRRLEDRLPGRVHLNGHPTQRLPNTLNVSIDGVAGRDLLHATPGVAAAVGAACHENDPQPSGVLTAMGLPATRATSAVRLTLGRWTSPTDVERAGDLLAATIDHSVDNAAFA